MKCLHLRLLPLAWILLGGLCTLPVTAADAVDLPTCAHRYGDLMVNHWLVVDLSRQVERAAATTVPAFGGIRWSARRSRRCARAESSGVGRK